jgi:hypothetical protein
MQSVSSRLSEIRGENERLDRIVTFLTAYCSIGTLALVLLPQIVLGSIAMYQVHHFEDIYCSGWSFMSINSYLNIYAIATMVFCGALGLSLIGSVFVCCGKMIIISAFCYILTLAYTIFYVGFLLIWKCLGVVVLIYSFDCHSHVIGQYVTTVFIVWFVSALTFSSGGSNKNDTSV